MITRIIIILGWTGMLAGIVFYLVHGQFGDPADMESRVAQTRQILLISAGVVAGGYLFKYLGIALGIGRYSRCKRCKKRVDKGEMYCFDHRRDSIWEAQERHRLDGSGVVRDHKSQP